MLRQLGSDKLMISLRRDRTDLEVLFREGATTAVLRFIEKTELGKKLTSKTNKYDLWDIDRLGRYDDEETTEYGGGFCE
jgi:hypothetical protein